MLTICAACAWLGVGIGDSIGYGPGKIVQESQQGGVVAAVLTCFGLAGGGPRGPDCSRRNAPPVVVPASSLDVTRHHGHALDALTGAARPSHPNLPLRSGRASSVVVGWYTSVWVALMRRKKRGWKCAELQLNSTGRDVLKHT